MSTLFLLGQHFDKIIVHLSPQDATTLAISRVPPAKIDELQEAPGWTLSGYHLARRTSTSVSGIRL